MKKKKKRSSQYVTSSVIYYYEKRSSFPIYFSTPSPPSPQIEINLVEM